jgi:hypothetical protein
VEEEPLVFSQSVELNGKDSTDEAIIAELKSMAKMSFTFGAFSAFGGDFGGELCVFFFSCLFVRNLLRFKVITFWAIRDSQLKPWKPLW